MGTTGSLSPKHKIYDPIRKAYVEATPEEQIRQHLITQLIALGYPPSLMVVEKALSELPHVRKESIPIRRVDLLCYAKTETLSPLLLVECKAEALPSAAERQLVGYNAYVGAPFLALVNGEEARLGIFDGEEWRFTPGLIPYKRLLDARFGK